MYSSSVINNQNIIGLIQRTLNHVDPRLVNHGKRVAYLVYKMLQTDGHFSLKEQQDICFLALLHDIGAYKTDEINEMAKFEAENIWEHSIYGYLFIKHFSPLSDWADVILFHHVSAKSLQNLDEKTAKVAQIINIADRVDIFWLFNQNKETLIRYLQSKKGDRFRDDVVNLFMKTLQHEDIMQDWNNDTILQSIMPMIQLTSEQCEMYLQMLIYAIDFRSQHTVTHTLKTASISKSLAEFMNLDDNQIHNIYYGALLHDLGKIGIPVEILEYPGKLSQIAMNIMRTHVELTKDILAGTVDPIITNIAIRHHEKLDGSGYPLGLNKDQLTIEEEVVAVGDIISALLGTRSYKEAYSKEKTIAILQQQVDGGKINQDIVNIFINHYDKILADVAQKCDPLLEIYYGLYKEYDELMKTYKTQDEYIPA